MEQLKDIAIALGILGWIFLIPACIFVYKGRKKDTGKWDWINKMLEEDEKRFAQDDERINKKMKELEEKRKQYDSNKRASKNP